MLSAYHPVCRSLVSCCPERFVTTHGTPNLPLLSIRDCNDGRIWCQPKRRGDDGPRCRAMDGPVRTLAVAPVRLARLVPTHAGLRTGCTGEAANVSVGAQRG